MRLEISNDAQISWHEVGIARTAVLVVDRFLKHAEELRTFALELNYGPPKGKDAYPGLKAFASLVGSSQVVQWIAHQVLSRRDSFTKSPDQFTLGELRSGCTFSVLACDHAFRPPNYTDLHIDPIAWLASVLHLSLNNEQRATAFWEHRPTGLQSWCAADPVQLARLESFFCLGFTQQFARAVQRAPQLSADSFMASMFKPNVGRRLFSPEEDEQWKLIGMVPAEFNRLVVYPTWQIHSIVDMTTFKSLSVDTMRLTMNQFVDFPIGNLFPYKTASTMPFAPKFYRSVDGLGCDG